MSLYIGRGGLGQTLRCQLITTIMRTFHMVRFGTFNMSVSIVIEHLVKNQASGPKLPSCQADKLIICIVDKSSLQSYLCENMKSAKVLKLPC